MGEGGNFAVCPNLRRSGIPVTGNRRGGYRVDRRAVEHRPELLDLRHIVLLRARCFFRDDVTDIPVEYPFHRAQIQWLFLGFEFSPLQPGLVEILAQRNILTKQVAVVVCRPDAAVLALPGACVHSRREVMGAYQFTRE